MPVTRSLLLLFLSLLSSKSIARLHHALPEDSYAFPKHRVAFLNGLPVRNETAQRWLKDGLKGGELEFLEQPWQDLSPLPPSTPKAIDSGAQHSNSHPPVDSTPAFSLEQMKLGPKSSYLCFIPSPTEVTTESDEKGEPEEATPDHSWSLLQPLSGRCLYHRQGWFTYSYCHNEKIRQFKELPHSHPHPPGGYIPEEDPEWEAYTLGIAPPTPEPGADLTVAEQPTITANLELSRESGSRYLVQRWGDGTICDKTGRKREVEVQFHCSMTVTDTILFVKEAKTCSYVLVIHTPRLCAEPGFKSRLDSHQETVIRCRLIVEDSATIQANIGHGDLSEAQLPTKSPKRKTVADAPAPPKNDDSTTPLKGAKDSTKDMIRKALEAIVGNTGDADFSRVVVEPIGENGEMIIEFIDDYSDERDDNRKPLAKDNLAEILRQAGYDIKGEWEAALKRSKKEGEEKDKDKNKKSEKQAKRHQYDEL